MKVTVKFRPIERQTLELLTMVHEADNNDPAATFSRLMSAAMVAGAMLSLTKEQIAQQAETLAEYAIKAVAERKDIFG